MGRCPHLSAGCTDPARRVHGHMTDRIGREGRYQPENRRSGAIWPLRVKRSVTPSAKPTLVRTQHLPPPAKTACGLGISGLAGRLAAVPLCVVVRHHEPLHSSGYGHIADGIRPEPAVHRTASFPGCGGHPAARPCRRPRSRGGRHPRPSGTSGSGCPGSPSATCPASAATSPRSRVTVTSGFLHPRPRVSNSLGRVPQVSLAGRASATRSRAPRSRKTTSRAS
jgi:hypothetical protein